MGLVKREMIMIDDEVSRRIALIGKKLPIRKVKNGTDSKR